MSMFDTILKVAPSIIEAGSSIFGAVSSSKANSKAAKKLAEAEQAKVALQKRIYGDLQKQSAPAVSYFRSMIARPEGLTGEQEDARDESRRMALNDISRTGLWGSGRAVTAALKKVNSDFTNQAIAQNRDDKTRAAGQLSGQYFSAADNLARGGSDAITNAAQAEAGAGLANSGLRGQAIGDIAGLISSEIKGRDSAYANPLKQLQEAFGLRDTQPAI
jgi:hypothetical protein